jgi:hypothetical protein
MARGDTRSVLTSGNKVVTGPEVALSTNPLGQLFLGAKPTDTVGTSRGPVTGIRVEKNDDKK